MTDNGNDEAGAKDVSRPVDALVKDFLEQLGMASQRATTQWHDFSQKHAEELGKAAKDARGYVDPLPDEQRELLNQFARLTGEASNIMLKFSELALEVVERENGPTLDKAGAIARRLVGLAARTGTQAAGGPGGQPGREAPIRTLNLVMPAEETHTEQKVTYVINRGDSEVVARWSATDLVGPEPISREHIRITRLVHNADPARVLAGQDLPLPGARRTPLGVEVDLDGRRVPPGTYRGMLAIDSGGVQQSVVLLVLDVT